jgi:hypothetical protein
MASYYGRGNTAADYYADRQRMNRDKMNQMMQMMMQVALQKKQQQQALEQQQYDRAINERRMALAEQQEKRLSTPTPTTSQQNYEFMVNVLNLPEDRARQLSFGLSEGEKLRSFKKRTRSGERIRRREGLKGEQEKVNIRRAETSKTPKMIALNKLVETGKITPEERDRSIAGIPEGRRKIPPASRVHIRIGQEKDVYNWRNSVEAPFYYEQTDPKTGVKTSGFDEMKYRLWVRQHGGNGSQAIDPKTGYEFDMPDRAYNIPKAHIREGVATNREKESFARYSAMRKSFFANLEQYPTYETWLKKSGLAGDRDMDKKFIKNLYRLYANPFSWRNIVK